MPVNLGDVMYVQAPVDCDVCGREWVAVFLYGTERLECPGCGFMTLAPPVLTGADLLDHDRYGDDEDDGEACPA